MTTQAILDKHIGAMLGAAVCLSLVGCDTGSTYNFGYRLQLACQRGEAPARVAAHAYHRIAEREDGVWVVDNNTLTYRPRDNERCEVVRIGESQ